MFHWIPVNVLHASGKIRLITNPMLPKPTLPQGRFATFLTRLRHGSSILIRRSTLLAHAAFDQCPPQRVVFVTIRQGPHTMQMIREQNPSVNIKRERSANFRHRRPQGVPHRFFKEERTPLIRDNSEKERPARNAYTSVIRHGVFATPGTLWNWCAKRTLRAARTV